VQGKWVEWRTEQCSVGRGTAVELVCWRRKGVEQEKGRGFCSIFGAVQIYCALLHIIAR
jgi:hypothetical protein